MILNTGALVSIVRSKRKILAERKSYLLAGDCSLEVESGFSFDSTSLELSDSLPDSLPDSEPELEDSSSLSFCGPDAALRACFWLFAGSGEDDRLELLSLSDEDCADMVTVCCHSRVKELNASQRCGVPDATRLRGRR